MDIARVACGLLRPGSEQRFLGAPQSASRVMFLTDILEQQLEEAAMLSSRHMRSVRSALQHLATLTELDRRIDAHLDCLNVDAENAWTLCETTLKFDEAGEVFVAAQVALASGIPECIQKIVEISCAAPLTFPGLIAALDWLPYARVASFVQSLSVSDIKLIVFLWYCSETTPFLPIKIRHKFFC